MVQEISVIELKALLEGDADVHLYDVRTEQERAICSIEGAVLLTQEVAEEIDALPKETKLVFHCHHGGRSYQAAAYFAQRGFSDCVNVAGGIDAWSLAVDPSTPRY